MVTIKGEYQGDLRCELNHGPSGATIATDAPKDNHGKGESFSPTDMVSGALGACMMTIMGIVAGRHAIDLKGSSFSVVKEMSESPRRIGKLTVDIYLPEQLTAEQKKILETAALTCPVHKSLNPDIDIPINFIYKVK